VVLVLPLLSPSVCSEGKKGEKSALEKKKGGGIYSVQVAHKPKLIPI